MYAFTPTKLVCVSISVVGRRPTTEIDTFTLLVIITNKVFITYMYRCMFAVVPDGTYFNSSSEAAGVYTLVLYTSVIH